MAATRAGRLRARLREPGLVVSPCCHDPLSARLIERCGPGDPGGGAGVGGAPAPAAPRRRGPG